MQFEKDTCPRITLEESGPARLQRAQTVLSQSSLWGIKNSPREPFSALLLFENTLNSSIFQTILAY